MYKLVWSLLSTDPQLNAEGIDAATLLGEQAVDTPKVRPFGVVRWGQNIPGVGRSTVRSLTVWYHDDPADYARINRCVKRTRAVLEGAVGVQDTDGGWLTQADWTDDSADLADDAYGTITRNTSFRVIGSSQ